MIRVLRLIAVSFLMVAAAPSALAGPIYYYAILDGPSEDPVNTSPGRGRALVGFDLDAQLLSVEATFRGLEGATTVAHIHGPTMLPGSGVRGVAVMPPTLLGFPAGVTQGSYRQTFSTRNPAIYTAAFVSNFGGGTIEGAETALGAMLANGTAYFNIHSNVYPGGEIRGFFQPVPEPSSLIIWAVGLLGMFGYVRTRRLRLAAS